MRVTVHKLFIALLCVAIGVFAPLHVSHAHGSIDTDEDRTSEPTSHAHGHGHHHSHHHSHAPESGHDGNTRDSEESPDHSHSVYDHAGLIFGKSKPLQDVLIWGPVVVFDDGRLPTYAFWDGRSDQSPPNAFRPIPADPRGPPAAS